MHKEELIALHGILTEIKDYFELMNPELKFSQYYALKIDPSQVHKSKMEHKYAIFVLGTELANAMKDVEFSSSGRISARSISSNDFPAPHRPRAGCPAGALPRRSSPQPRMARLRSMRYAASSRGIGAAMQCQFGVPFTSRTV